MDANEFTTISYLEKYLRKNRIEKATVTIPAIRSDRAYLMATESLMNEVYFPSSDFSLVVRMLKGCDGMKPLKIFA